MSFWKGSEQASLQPGRVDIAVLPDSRGVVHHLVGIWEDSFIAVPVFSGGVNILPVDRSAQVVVDFLFV